MQNDPLSAALSNVLNAERIGKKKVTVKPFSKQMITVMKIMSDSGYVGETKIIEDGRGNMLEIALTGNINKCGAIKPRFSVRKNEFERFEKNYLPAKDFGMLVVSTPKGMMTHIDGKEKGLGGKLIAYCY